MYSLLMHGLGAFLLAVAAQAATAAPHPAISAALAHPDRPSADREIDARRHPDLVLEFFAIRPGMRVLDMFSSTGYYTEILSRVVGSEGEVLAHNNLAYREYAAEGIAQRYAAGRLPNVERLDVEVGELRLPEGQLDVALLILSYHDLYYMPGDDSWPLINGTAMLAEIFDGLKPGGVLGIVDHAAAAGGDKIQLATRLHRIDEGIVRKEIEAAGFVFDGASEALRNPNDDRSQPVFAEGIRGQTDRFVLRFRKPAE